MLLQTATFSSISTRARFTGLQTLSSVLTRLVYLYSISQCTDSQHCLRFTDGDPDLKAFQRNLLLHGLGASLLLRLVVSEALFELQIG